MKNRKLSYHYKKNIFKRVRASVLFLIFFIQLVTPSIYGQQKTASTAVIYYNEACSMCAIYLKAELIPTLKEIGVQDYTLKDFVNEKENRVELNRLNREFNIPPTLQGHFMIFIDNKIVLGGHVPKQVIVDLLSRDLEVEKILVLQDKMRNAESYQAWGFKGEAKEYEIQTPIDEYLNWFNENKNSLKEPENSYEEAWDATKMLPLILSTGFLDGINPCAFAVLLLFITFLYTIRKTKTHVLQLGATYIVSIFLAYLLIGIGLVKAFVFSGDPHLIAVVSAYLMIALGLLNISGFIFPNMKFHLGIPSFSKEYLKRWMYKATIPTTFVLGFLVGLCTFPCSGGMYVAIVGLLATKTSFTQGIIYLILYNIMFVMPLIVILVLASSKKATDKITQWEQSNSRIIKLISGKIMVVVGLVILIWFV